MKTCIQCQLAKTLQDFHKHNHYKDGHHSICRLCVNEKQRQRYIKDRVSILKKQKIHRIKTKSPQRRAYRLSLNEINALYEKFNHRCAICADTDNLVIDHNHVSNKIRGVLCNRCNLGIGFLKENINNLLSAIKYLAPADGSAPPP